MWRFAVYENALYNFDKAIELIHNEEYSKVEKQIKLGFKHIEYTPIIIESTARKHVEIAISKLNNEKYGDGIVQLETLIVLVQKEQKKILNLKTKNSN